MVRTGILLALAGVLLVVAGSLQYAHVVTFPHVSAELSQTISWVSWALGGVFFISGTGALLTARTRRRGPP